MKQLLILSLLFPMLTFAQSDILFILDASGSMNAQLEGESQIAAAKKAINAALPEIPSTENVGLRVYAHRAPQSDKAASCMDSELLVPLAAANSATISSKLSTIEAKGYTPIAYSLSQAKNDFSLSRESEKSIILLSDGEETCGGDPVQAVKDLIAAGFKVTVHTIGFKVDEKTKAQLQSVAAAGNGKYFSANNSGELTSALTEAAKQTVLEKSKATYGQTTRGGDSFETAVNLEKDQEYRLDHHQKVKDYDYFSINLKSGQELLLELNTTDKGVDIDKNNNAKADDSPYAGIVLVGMDRQKIKKEDIIGKKFGKALITYNVAKDGTYYVLVGSEYHSMPSDGASFKYTIVSKGDLGTEGDAGAGQAQALSITPGRYNNFLGAADEVDTFSFEGKAGQSASVGVIPGDGIDVYYTARIYDEFKREILKITSAKSGEGFKSDFVPLADGKLFLEISLPYSKPEKSGGYTLIWEVK